MSKKNSREFHFPSKLIGHFLIWPLSSAPIGKFHIRFGISSLKFPNLGQGFLLPSSACAPAEPLPEQGCFPNVTAAAAKEGRISFA